MKKERWILAVLCGATTITLIASIFFHAIKIKRKGGYYTPQGGPELLAKWRSEPFSSIDPTGGVLDAISNQAQAQISHSGWTVEQRNELADSIRRMLLAFSTGNYEDYQRFRFPIKDGRFVDARITQMYNGLQKSDPNFSNYALDKGAPEFPWKTFEHFWVFSGITTNVFCSKCWKGVSLQSLKVRVFARTETPPALNDVIGHDENVGVNWWNPTFEFDPDITQLIHANKFVDAAVVSVLITMEPVSKGQGKSFGVTEESKATPVYCLFYWVPAKHVWLPSAFGGAYSGSHKALYVY